MIAHATAPQQMGLYNGRPAIRRLLWAWLLLCTGFVTTLPGLALAQGRDPALEALYSVSGVPVDATAKSAVEARETARRQGERAAFQLLVERLVIQPADRARVPVPQGDALTNMINSFEVDDERSSSVRYLGRYTFRFDPTAIRAHFAAANVAALEQPAARALILPVLDVAGEPVLWVGPNPWLDLWLSQPPVSPLVPMDLPLGDLEDVSAVDAATAIRGPSPENLQALMVRYNVPRVITLLLTTGGGQLTPSGALTLRVIQHLAGLAPQEVMQGVPPAGTETERLAVAARLAAETINTLPTDGAAMPPMVLAQQAGSRVAVTVPLNALADWVAIRTRLLASGSPLVQLQALTVAQATVELGYTNAQTLVAGLDRQGLVLVQDDGFPVHPATAGEAHLRMGVLTLRRR